MGLFLLIPSVSAQDVGQLCTGADLSFHSAPGSHPCDTGTDDHGNPIPASSKLSDLLARIINFISIIVAIAAILMIIYAGFRLVTSGGSAESTKSARDTILYAVIGLVVVLFAQVIVKFVLAKITGGSESS
ncbi:MAG TPA: TrbC/VirB2 family protein [Candidatus Saccharimonadales bacterium]|nr:TrbC/VirB2 family protein [Candidatus Saccharimonadales bacterium]